ncbi:GON-4-like protein isoform X2 [Takifugu flavidus]|uniref:GON-4-like protein isoform X2 n=1 Tax=Takifugu flavidus TaxID=433684 RepID=UPI002544A12F|nr:GON-4-like protein isoform X2 [Takifugu flavidus]
MNPVRKRLRLSPSTPRIIGDTAGPSICTTEPLSCSPPRFSHDALPLSLATGGPTASRVEEEEGYLVVEEDATDSSLIITMEDSQLEMKAQRRRPARNRKRKMTEHDCGASESEGEVEIDKELDQSLETKSRQHNLTTVNVKNIIHEVITNEHVVAMMKAAINETEAVPPFEPKMTRSKLKEVVEKGVVIPAWNISPIKKTGDVKKPPQFVDILLAEEDSSDEEYRPDEEDEDETAEDTFQESDMESVASSPRGSRLSRVEDDSCSPWQTSRTSSSRMRVSCVSMGPPPPPRAQPPKAVTDSSFLEKLHAVEEELAVCMKPYQPLSESEDDVAYRTRSKRPLRDVPLGQLEAELRAPDITPDMYDSNSAHEDREWTHWLRGLMNTEMDNEEECDDDDDPEYNFLADIDEPDLEDYRDDKAVRITKKEVNELMEELFETLKEDLAGQEMEDEGREEEEDPQEEGQSVEIRLPVEEENNSTESTDQLSDGPTTMLKTVKQQLTFMRRKQQLSQQTHARWNGPEPQTLRLEQRQRLRLQQQLQQHVQLLTQVHLLSSPVAKLHSEAETTRQFLFELELLAQRGELLMSAGHRSIFRASNLQSAQQLLEELQQTPIRYQPKVKPPDARGYMRCYPTMPAELAWLFATRAVFLYPELLPCASLDPALYCPRRTTAFTAAEDCLLVLGLRNMEGSVDPTKLVSQFLLRKTLVQVRRRILQCCRPGFPDNIVKAYRYQRVLRPMAVACRHVHPAEQRPPVEREERVLPLWLARSLPVLHLIITRYNSPCGSMPEAPPPHRSSGARHSHMSITRSTAKSCSFSPGTKYPARLPNNLDLKRIGFVLLQQPVSHSSESAPLPASQQRSSSIPPGPLSCPADTTESMVSLTTKEKIRLHYHTLMGLRRRQDGESDSEPSPSQHPTQSQKEAKETPDINSSEGWEGEEEEEQSQVCLVLSESSSSTGSDELEEPTEVESECGRRPADEGVDGSESTELQEEPQEEEEELRAPQEEDRLREECDDDQRQQEEKLFAQEYLLRVCNAVQEFPDVAEQLLQVLDHFSAAPAAPETLYGGLRDILQPFPQLLQDFAAFLTPTQARRCGLFLEQQLFQRSRQFLRRLGRSLGEGSALYQQVVSVLQGSSASRPEDLEKITPLLRHHPDLQEELWGLFQQFHGQSLSLATANKDMNCVSQNPPDGNRRKEGEDVCEESETGRDAEEEKVSGRPVFAKNISLISSGEKVIMWTREADRAILMACQQRGASWKTFRDVSAQLGNRTAKQVSLRFHDLMKLFHSAFQNSSS